MRTRSTVGLASLLAAICGAWVLAAAPSAQLPAPPAAPAQKPATADVLLGQALHQEQNEGRLQDAIATYTKVLSAADATRAQKARAQFRIGACYEKLGAAQAAQARKAYAAVVGTYGDQSEFAMQARARLGALANGSASGAVPGASAGPVSRLLWRQPDWWAAELSPDGRLIAFIDQATANLWVRDIAAGTDRKLTNIPLEKVWSDFPLQARWSSDGTRLAFDWYTQEGKDGTVEIRTIDLKTGAIDTFPRTRELRASFPFDWSPDGSRVLVELEDDVMAWLTLTDGSVTALSKVRSPGLLNARVSPDGARIAFGAHPSAARVDLDVFVTTADGSSTAALVDGPADDRPVAWTPDGTGVLHTGEHSGVYGLWLAGVGPGMAASSRQLVTEMRATYSGISRSGKLLVIKGSGQADLWLATVDLVGGRLLGAKALPIPGGAAPKEMGAFSLDGRAMLYTVGFGNRSHLVIAAPDGSNARTITPPFTPTFWGPPSWATDSTAVFVDGFSQPALRGIYRLDVASGTTTEIVPPFPYRPPGKDSTSFVAVSPDGKTIYKQINHADPRLVSLWTHDVQSGVESELFRSAGPAGLLPTGLSPDGTRLAFVLNPFADNSQRQMMVVPVSGGESKVLCSFSGSTSDSVWAPDGRSLLYTLTSGQETERTVEVWQVSTDGGQPRKLGISHQVLRGLAVHPDGKRVAYVGGNRPNEEVWLFENFLPPAKAPAAAAAAAKK